MGKEHATKWNSEIFMDGTAVTKGEFVERVIGMGFAPPLGVPSMAAINEMSIIIVGIAKATEAKEEISNVELLRYSRHMNAWMTFLDGTESSLYHHEMIEP